MTSPSEKDFNLRHVLASSKTHCCTRSIGTESSKDETERYRLYMFYQRSRNGRTSEKLCTCLAPFSIVEGSSSWRESLCRSHRNGTSRNRCQGSCCIVCKWRKHSSYMLFHEAISNFRGNDRYRGGKYVRQVRSCSVSSERSESGIQH